MAEMMAACVGHCAASP